MDTQEKYDALLTQWGYDGSEFKYTKKVYVFAVRQTKKTAKWLIKARTAATKNTLSKQFTTQF